MNLINLKLLLCSLHLIVAFNVSPYPNVILKNPSRNGGRSSYFGFSLILRKNHILIGAPRANSTLYSQSKMEEPGMIYKCTFDEKCNMFVMDNEGNNQKYNIYDQRKNNRLLGFSMDGHDSEDDKFVACAPKELTEIFDYRDNYHEYFMFGTCYFSENSRTAFISKIAPLRNSHKLYYKGPTPVDPNYMFGESGFSAHIPDSKDKIIMGCPGVANGMGSVNEFYFKTRREYFHYQGTVPDPEYHANDFISHHSYLGYAVTSGKFFAPLNNYLFYVASAPRTKYHGSVEIFIIDEKEKKILYNTIKGEQYGSYFGYALVCDDFNNDGKPDLAVSAPFFTENNYDENGAVYIYFNQAWRGIKNGIEYWVMSFKKFDLKPPKNGKSFRFGTALGKIGDINGDGFNDLAISGSLNGKEVIYIYNGARDGLKLSQKIEMPDKSSMFGFSISRGVDIDGNGYNDIAVGAPNSDEVYIYKSFPVISVEASLKSSKNQLTMNDKVTITACLRIKSKVNQNFRAQFSTKLYNDTSIPFVSNKPQFVSLTEECRSVIFDVNVHHKDAQKPIVFKYKFELINPMPQKGRQFCQNCVSLNPHDKKEVSLSLPINVKGCKSFPCKPDLMLTAKVEGLKDQLICGEVKNLPVHFSITNKGETAYSSELSVVVPEFVKYFKIPSNCLRIKMGELNCKINSNQPFYNGKTYDLDVILDVSRVQGGSWNISMQVSSAGDEINENDNFASFTIKMQENSKLEVRSQSHGQYSASYINFKDTTLKSQNMKLSYEIFNHGPSSLSKFSFGVLIPQYYNDKLEIIKMERISCIYKTQVLNIEWNNVEGNDTKLTEASNKFSNFSDDQTILIDCDQNYVKCIKAEVTILNFEHALEVPIKINIKFNVDKKTVDQTLDTQKYRWLFRTKFFSTPNNETFQTLNVTSNDYILVIESELSKPIWIYIVSTIGGLLLFVVIILVFYKLGFFTRKMKQELKQKKRETLAAAGQSNTAFETTEEVT